jgi:hypothetical protein
MKYILNQEYALFNSINYPSLTFHFIVATVKGSTGPVCQKIEQYVASMLLYEAVTEQDEKIVENLLTQYKADPTVKAASGVSAFSWSLETPKGSFHVVERLCAGAGGLTLLDGKQCIIRGTLGSSVGVAPTIQPNCRSTAR